MKILFCMLGACAVIIMICLALQPWYLNGAQSATPMFTTSRFAMISGTYSPSPGKTEDGIFKLDTYTGKAWKLTVSMDVDGKRIDKWLPIEE